MPGILKIRDPNTGEFVAIPAIQGEQGPQGVSPTVTVDAIEGGHRVTITDSNGTQSFDVMDGVDGQDGAGGSGSSVELDTTLTQSGKAADAKAVGDRLNELNEANATQDTEIAKKANTDDLATVAKSGSYTDLTNKPTIPTVPSSLPNPNKLILTGAVTAEYDGSAPVSVEIPSGGGSAYELPIASPTTLGGVKPAAKTDEMTQAVGVDALGGLWALPGGEKDWTKICGGNITEEVASITIDANADGTPISNLDINEMVIMGRIYLTGNSDVRYEYNGLWTSGNYFTQSKLGAWSHAFIIHIVRYLDRWCVKYNGGTTAQVITPKLNFVSFEMHSATDGVLFDTETDLNVYYR